MHIAHACESRILTISITKENERVIRRMNKKKYSWDIYYRRAPNRYQFSIVCFKNIIKMLKSFTFICMWREREKIKKEETVEIKIVRFLGNATPNDGQTLNFFLFHLLFYLYFFKCNGKFSRGNLRLLKRESKGITQIYPATGRHKATWSHRSTVQKLWSEWKTKKSNIEMDTYTFWIRSMHLA